MGNRLFAIEELQNIVKGHEYYIGGYNIILIRKNNSNRGEIASFKDFSGKQKFVRTKEEVLIDSLGDVVKILDSLNDESTKYLIEY